MDQDTHNEYVLQGITMALNSIHTVAINLHSYIRAQRGDFDEIAAREITDIADAAISVVNERLAEFIELFPKPRGSEPPMLH